MKGFDQGGQITGNSERWEKPIRQDDMFICLVLGKENVGSFDYRGEQASALSYWERERHRINRLPQNVPENRDGVHMIPNLTVQLMQGFCYPSEKIPFRQGGAARSG